MYPAAWSCGTRLITSQWMTRSCAVMSHLSERLQDSINIGRCGDLRIARRSPERKFRSAYRCRWEIFAGYASLVRSVTSSNESSDRNDLGFAAQRCRANGCGLCGSLASHHQVSVSQVDKCPPGFLRSRKFDYSAPQSARVGPCLSTSKRHADNVYHFSAFLVGAASSLLLPPFSIISCSATSTSVAMRFASPQT